MEKMPQHQKKEHEKNFWENSVVYQVYPWTFNEDEAREPQLGHGSIAGITEKLDYLKKDVGVDALWLSPFYPSPMKDGGYDVIDMTAVHEELGTLADFEALVTEAHERDMKIMIDLMPNHTSNEHSWFQESRSSKDNSKADWYIWHDGVVDADGNRRPPNNWASVFSLPQLEARKRGELDVAPGDMTPPISAWTWDDERQQYYLHSFANFQPDLNWSNPDVRAAIKDIMRTWLDRGVDGFRIDAVNYIGKNMDFTDEDTDTAYVEGVDNPYDQLRRYNSCGYPWTFYRHVREMTDVLYEDKYKDRDTRIILEAYMGEHELKKLNEIAPGKASTFNFGALDLSWQAPLRWIQARAYYNSLPEGGVANQVNGNHDKPRLASRLGDEAARAAGLHNILLPGMTFIYNGEELGLHNAKIPKRYIKDPNGLRDPERTPMLWDGHAKHHGFSRTDRHLYLPLNQADTHLDVAAQRGDPDSSLALYKSAIELKHELTRPRYVSLIAKTAEGEHHDDVMAYGVESDDKRFTVMTNFASREVTAFVPNYAARAVGSVALSSVAAGGNSIDDSLDLKHGVRLGANEAIVIRH